MEDKSNQIPVIDIAPFQAGRADGKAAVAAQVKRACEEIGFFTIVGHGVAPALIEETRNVSNRFFDLPLEQKLKIKRAPGAASRGYAVTGDLALAYSRGDKSPPDYQEGFGIGALEFPADDPYYHTEMARKFIVPNVWPERPPTLRSSLERYYRVMAALSADIMRIFALALDLDEHFFVGKIDKAVSFLRIIRYPAQSDPPLDGQLRAGAHTDYGTLTILLAEDKPGGLQVQVRDGNWVDVHPLPDSFVINIGDLMMQWTNDHWVSNLHRVANPPPQFAEVPRLSVVFFHQPNYDAEIRCIEKYAGAASMPKYPPTTAGAHWIGKQSKARNVNAAR
ncbi:MAG TPA: 2-oxoglutarate and iron-dependent oxygenase domain-containing protein [Stellaceae bacterium]|nr:2-oxoglutarate and iron-dependent oxygenase domain-containing protein [Stellaceae bacterium]